MLWSSEESVWSALRLSGLQMLSRNADFRGQLAIESFENGRLRIFSSCDCLLSLQPSRNGLIERLCRAALASLIKTTSNDVLPCSYCTSCFELPYTCKLTSFCDLPSRTAATLLPRSSSSFKALLCVTSQHPAVDSRSQLCPSRPLRHHLYLGYHK